MRLLVIESSIIAPRSTGLISLECQRSMHIYIYINSRHKQGVEPELPLFLVQSSIASVRAGSETPQQWQLADCLAHVQEDVVGLHVTEYTRNRQHKCAFLP